MNHRFITIPLFAVLVFGSAAGPCPAAPSGTQEQQKQPKSSPKPSGNTMTGCLDEQDGKYVLTDDRDLKAIATLEADGFPTEGFAKHVGHKVTVRGTVNSDAPLPIFKVRSIETVSETCTPQQK